MRTVYGYRLVGPSVHRRLGEGIWFPLNHDHVVLTHAQRLKVITNVARIVDRLGPDAFEEEPSSPQITSQHDSAESLVTASSSSTLPVDGRETTRRRLLQELVDTERKYVQDLEVMQVSSRFPPDFNCTGILIPASRNIPQRCHAPMQLIKIPSITYSQTSTSCLTSSASFSFAWRRSRSNRCQISAGAPSSWLVYVISSSVYGRQLILCSQEPDFVVYEPYCANYNRATDLMMANEHLLMVGPCSFFLEQLLIFYYLLIL